MKRRILMTILGVGCLTAFFLSAAGWADVVSKPQVVSARPGGVFYVPLDLDVSSGELVAGINGQMQYDPALFSNPVAQNGHGALGFTALGNETEPGKYRFVLYADPTAILNLDNISLFVQLTAASSLPMDGMSTITFHNGPLAPEDPDKAGESAASTPDGVSVPSVTFSDVIVALNETAASEWLLYH